ncbi:MAG TPA: hypothetical protein VMV10_17450 [Pirellulales bacterium]|nr:hypothetical protein [Pirellulales bacterium]
MSFLLRRLRSKSRGRSSRRLSRTFKPRTPIGRTWLRLENLEQRALLDGGGFLLPAAGPATHFALWAPPNETVGSQTPLEVVALDASNHVARNYAGTVSFASTDSNTTLPTDYTFAASDHGHHLFQFTPGVEGSETISATDSADSTISGNITVNVDPAPVATHFLVYAPEDTTVGSSTNILVVALDASNHRVDGYTGTVTLTTDDPGVSAPLTYTFTSSDHGFHVFQEKFATAGTRTVTATDDSTPPLTGTASINVNPAPVATHFLVYAPENTTVGKATNIVVVALDASNHRVDGYTGTVTLTTSDTGATVPASYTFTSSDHGIHVFQVTFASTGTQTVNVADDSTPPLTGTASINVNPAPVATHFAIFAKRPVVSGQPFTLEVVALDASNHRVPNYTGTVRLTSSVSGETLPAAYTFTAADEGEHEFQVTLNTTGADTLTASDGTLSGGVTVNVQSAPSGTSGGALRAPRRSPCFAHACSAAPPALNEVIASRVRR